MILSDIRQRDSYIQIPNPRKASRCVQRPSTISVKQVRFGGLWQGRDELRRRFERKRRRAPHAPTSSRVSHVDMLLLATQDWTKRIDDTNKFSECINKAS
jgi:hypothetical protein